MTDTLNEPVELDNDELSNEPSEELLAPPEHWKGEHKELFSSQPREVQEFMIERYKDMEGDYTRKTQELSKYRKLGEGLEEAITPYKQDFQMNGLDETGAVKQLLAVHDLLKNDPEKGLTWLAQQYNYSPSIPTESNEEEGYIDPVTQSLKQELNELKSGMSEFKQAQLKQAQQEVLNQFNNFGTAKDEGGNPAHPLYEEVKHQMAQLYQSGFKDLNTAYRMSIASNPELQQKEESFKLERKKLEEKQAVIRAKKAAQGVKSSSSANVNPNKTQSTRDFLESWWAENVK